MNFQKNARITLYAGRFLGAVVVGLCFFLRDLLSWYHSFRALSWQAAAAILGGYYLCVPMILGALFFMDRLLLSILRGGVFLERNVGFLRRICLCCAGVSAVSLVCGIFYQPLLFLFAIMAFLSLSVSVVENVMAAAVAIREENDLTV